MERMMLTRCLSCNMSLTLNVNISRLQADGSRTKDSVNDG